MKSLSGMGIPQLSNTASPSSDIKYWISSLLYYYSEINRWNISSDINYGSYDKCLFPLSKMNHK